MSLKKTSLSYPEVRSSKTQNGKIQGPKGCWYAGILSESLVKSCKSWRSPRFFGSEKMLVEICSQLPINRCGGKDPYDPIREDLRNFLLKLRLSFHFDPKLNGRFHHLISSWRDASKLSQEIWPQEFFKKTPSCELQVTWILEDKTLLSMEWSLIQHSLERKPQWPQPINPSRLLESLFACLDFF